VLPASPTSPSGGWWAGARSHPSSHRLVRSAGTAISLNASAIYLGISLGGLLGGWVVHTAGANRLWLLAGSWGTVALLLVPVSVAAERRSAAVHERRLVVQAPGAPHSDRRGAPAHRGLVRDDRS
jgi:MFS family permease